MPTAASLVICILALILITQVDGGLTQVSFGFPICVGEKLSCWMFGILTAFRCVSSMGIEVVLQEDERDFEQTWTAFSSSSTPPVIIPLKSNITISIHRMNTTLCTRFCHLCDNNVLSAAHEI